ncbi:hypothetical protein GCK72_011830 [Caenorhabditis remanei]|uniref:Uncharacterized protein n=1 Tax=Caenorhabditis remanei TaxID=31234 RepID=A0A6A5H9R5_CAERE|nr:hypothetical protein GCK72_011830 [Caenorhabditis remanei]KAF1763564.1 hypothetical protein GCK72_011830 [Caenorhabditis remanei]
MESREQEVSAYLLDDKRSDRSSRHFNHLHREVDQSECDELKCPLSDVVGSGIRRRASLIAVGHRNQQNSGEVSNDILLVFKHNALQIGPCEVEHVERNGPSTDENRDSERFLEENLMIFFLFVLNNGKLLADQS